MQAVNRIFGRFMSFLKMISPVLLTTGVIITIVALMIIFKGIILQLLGTLLLLIVVVIGFIYLWRFIFGLLALAAIVAGVFLAFGIVHQLLSLF